MEGLAADPAGGRAGEVAGELGDVHRIGVVERAPSAVGVIRQPAPDRRVIAAGMRTLTVTPYGAISLATASLKAAMPPFAAT